MLGITKIKDVKVKIGEACKALRKSNDLSREDLAEVLDVSSTTIQNIENGKNATLDNVLKVANHFFNTILNFWNLANTQNSFPLFSNV